MPHYQQRPKATGAESRFLCILPGSWHQQMQLFKKQNRNTCFTALGFIWCRENTATWKTPNSWLHPQGPPFRECEHVCAAECSLFQDLTDTQASAFGITRMSQTSQPQDAASCFWQEESIKLCLGGRYVSHSASKLNAGWKILLKGNCRVLWAYRAHPSLQPHRENLQERCCYSSFESPGCAEPHTERDRQPLHLR